MAPIFRIIILALLNLIVHTGPLHSQIATTPEPASAGASPAENQKFTEIIANWRGTLLSTEQALARAGLEESDLAEKSADISKIRQEASALDLQLAPLVLQIKAQLDELGPEPNDGEPPESVESKDNRKQLLEKFSLLDGNTKAARLIVIRAGQLEEQIITNRRTKFVRQITRHTTSIFDLKLWRAFWQGLDGMGARFGLLITESVSAMRSGPDSVNQKPAVFLLLLLGMTIIVAMTLFYLRQLLSRRSQRLVEKFNSPGVHSPEDHYVNTRVAGMSFLATGLVPAAGLCALYFIVTNAVGFTARLDDLVQEIVFVVSAMIISLALAKAFLSPHNSARRLASLSDSAAQKSYRIIRFTVILVVLIRLFNKTAVILVSPFEVSIALSGLLALICLTGLFLVLVAMTSKKDTPPSQVAIRRNLVRWGYLNPVFWISFVAGSIALMTGYIAFAEFLAWQIMIGAAVFALLWLCIELLDLHRDRFLDADSGRWRLLSQVTGFTRQTVLQASVFGFGLAKLAAILTALVVFMISWGYRTGDWAGPVSEAFFGFKVGGLSISLASIVMAVLLFAAGYVVTKTIQHWLRHQFLPTTALDPGLRNSIATILGYAGIVLAALLAITAAGLDLSKVAIVAGALSVGIGFGLQSIVNNFVSGLILLAERPIKAGDWIVTSGGEGTVRKTSVRSTEIETFDGATVIIPNSTLITDAVTNWTHHTQKGRIRITIGVGYDSDPEKVRDILLACGQSHDRVVTNPAPAVFFQDFGADALIFELRAYLADINNSASTKSDLRFSILAALRKAKIKIPYPQRDIHIKSGQLTNMETRPVRKNPAPRRSTKTKSA